MKNSVLCYLEETAKKFADREAVVDKDGSITFAELREMAVKAANAIIDRTTKIQRPILVFLPKGKETIAMFMGIVYSRNMYVPTEYNYPKERICAIIDVLQPMMIISDDAGKERLESFGIDIPVILQSEIEGQEVKYSGESLCKKGLLYDLVYIIFTSGSTGVPKGVTISNINILEYIDWATEVFGDNEETRMGSLAPLYFDLSTHEIYTCLSKGATLVLVPEKYIAFPAAIIKFIREQHVNYLYWVPSAYVNVATLDLLKSVELDEIKSMIFGGEVMPVKTLNYWRRHLPNLRFIANMYGPTEATANCTYYVVDREYEDTESLPLGKACDIKDMFILDENNNEITPDQPNVQGELCVCGTSLSKGYWNDKEMTDKHFMQNPLIKEYNEMMYRTGDLVYYDEQGQLCYVGRKDFQIKHMGYRIEIGEIENAILHANIVENVCVLYDKDNKKIVMVYCNNEEIEPSKLIREIGAVLPKYMVPSVCMYQKTFPVTGSGKMDRKKIASLYFEK